MFLSLEVARRINVEVIIIMFPLEIATLTTQNGEASPSPRPKREPVSAADPDTNPPPTSDAKAGGYTRPAMPKNGEVIILHDHLVIIDLLLWRISSSIMISCCDYQIWSASPHPSPSSSQTWFPGKPHVDFNDFPIWNLHVVRGLPSEPCLIIQGKSMIKSHYYPY